MFSSSPENGLKYFFFWDLQIIFEYNSYSIQTSES